GRRIAHRACPRGRLGSRRRAERAAAARQGHAARGVSARRARAASAVPRGGGGLRRGRPGGGRRGGRGDRVAALRFAGPRRPALLRQRRCAARPAFRPPRLRRAPGRAGGRFADRAGLPDLGARRRRFLPARSLDGDRGGGGGGAGGHLGRAGLGVRAAGDGGPRRIPTLQDRHPLRRGGDGRRGFGRGGGRGLALARRAVGRGLPGRGRHPRRGGRPGRDGQAGGTRPRPRAAERRHFLRRFRRGGAAGDAGCGGRGRRSALPGRGGFARPDTVGGQTADAGEPGRQRRRL
ncbi:MAG: Geranylgeranyl diphosphate synthase, partial [uncultured Acetobacteraceae bacterium]